MFDAYFAPPFFDDADARRMAHFGVRACLLMSPRAFARAHAGEVIDEAAVVASLATAGIRSFIADAISPEVEPERAWHEAWARLRARVHAREVHAIGELLLLRGGPRAFRMLDRHLALAEEAQVPVLVAHAPWLEPRWQEALAMRARAHAARWHWTRATPEFAASALADGARVIAAVSGRRFAPEALAVLLEGCAPEARARLAVGSARGRGLNPFALAAAEIALARAGQQDAAELVLRRPELLRALEASSPGEACLRSAGVAGGAPR